MASSRQSSNGASAILERMIRPKISDLSETAARALLRLKLDREDHERMHELAEKNQNDALTEAEDTELQTYLNIGMALDLLQAKARVSLKRATARR